MHNNIPLNELDSTHVAGSKLIDTIEVSAGIFDFVEGVNLLDNNEVAITDHWSHLIDFNLEDFFNT